MDQWINYHHLYYFFIIAQKGSITEAAQFLRLGSPTLSTQLKQLEDRFNTALFDRQGKKLILTEQGRIVYEYANEIFKLGSELNEVMREQRVSGRPHLHIGALDCIPKSFIANVVQAAQKHTPCSVTISEGSMEQLIRELHQHRVDLVLTNFSTHSSSHSSTDSQSFAKLMLRSKIGIFGAAKFKSLKKGFPQSLNDAPIVLPAMTSRLRSELDRHFHLNQITPQVVAETQDMSVQKILGARGLGVVPLPIPAVSNTSLAKDMELLGTLDDVVEEYYMVAAERKIANPIAAAIFRSLKPVQL